MFLIQEQAGWRYHMF